MSRAIRCVCIDDSNRPVEVPANKWPKEGQEYHITHIFLMMQQGKIQGCELAEFDISMCVPFNCYRLNRFAIHKDDLEKLMQMIKDCDELNTIDDDKVRELVEDMPLITTNTNDHLTDALLYAVHHLKYKNDE